MKQVSYHHSKMTKKIIMCLKSEGRKPKLVLKRISNRVQRNLKNYVEKNREGALKFKRKVKITF